MSRRFDGSEMESSGYPSGLTDTLPDPHGRATELESLGGVLRRFYEEGVVSNPCDGPCDENDLL